MANPSLMPNSKLYLDINFLTMDIFAQNNYLYVPGGNHNTFEAFKKYPDFPTNANGKYVLDYYNDKSKKKAFVNFRLNGPSAMLVYGNHAFAITDAIRSVTSIRGIEVPTAKFAFEGLDYTPQQNISYKNKNFKIAELTWGEIGLSYAYQYKIKNKDCWSAGISIRHLWGFDGSYLTGNDVDYIVPNDSTIVINNLDAEYGLINRTNDDITGFGKSGMVKGTGWAFDIGITYTKLRNYTNNAFLSITKPCKSKYLDYDYRIGVSIIDLGAINYKAGSTYSLKTNVQDSIDINPFYQIKTIEAFNNTLSNSLYHNDYQTYSGEGYRIGLPSALSIQYDYHFKNDFYFNATLIKDFNLYKYHVSRPTILAFTPRYERRWFECQIPVSLYDYTNPRVGLAFRVRNFSIGTDKLGSFFNFNDLSGADLYFSLRVNFLKGKCPSKYKKYNVQPKKQVKDCNCPDILDTESNRWKHKKK
jgi:hypothetical protein